VLRRLRGDVGARGWVLVCAMLLDAIVLGAFAASKLETDPGVVGIAAGLIVVTFALERLYVGRWTA
jgi:hypothetical protein